MEWKTIDTAPKDREILVNDEASYGMITLVTWDEIGYTGKYGWCLPYVNAIFKCGNESENIENEINSLSDETIIKLVEYEYTPTLWCEVPKPTEEQEDYALTINHE